MLATRETGPRSPESQVEEETRGGRTVRADTWVEGRIHRDSSRAKGGAERLVGKLLAPQPPLADSPRVREDDSTSSPPPPSAHAPADLGIDLAVGEVGGRPHPPRRSRRLSSATARARAITPRTPSRARADEPIKVIGMRRRIAENMAASKRAIPHFTYVDEIDVTALEDMRADLNANRGSRPKLTMLPLMIVAICRSIPDFPMINARYDDEAGVVTRHGSVHLGMATQTDAGPDGPGDPRRAGYERLAARQPRSPASPRPPAPARRRARSSAVRPSPSPRSARSAASRPRRSSIGPRSRSSARTRSSNAPSLPKIPRATRSSARS